MRQQQIFLKHVADLSRSGSDFFIIQIHMSFLRCGQAGKNVKQCRLSGTADTKKAYQLTLIQFDIDIFDDRSLSIYFCNMFCF